MIKPQMEVFEEATFVEDSLNSVTWQDQEVQSPGFTNQPV